MTSSEGTLQIHLTKSGAGWANTWHRRIPFQRIDYIYTSLYLDRFVLAMS